jgi:hypothetical protein
LLWTRETCPRNANKASETSEASSTHPASSFTTPGMSTASQNTQQTSQSAQSVREFTGNASLCSFDPSHPLCPLQLDADADWNADTGATSHMTPHCHWLCNYAPRCIPIKLANNSIVYIQRTVSLLSSQSVALIFCTVKQVYSTLSSQSVAQRARQ